jgi:hypothetical protein
MLLVMSSPGPELVPAPAAPVAEVAGTQSAAPSSRQAAPSVKALGAFDPLANRDDALGAILARAVAARGRMAQPPRAAAIQVARYKIMGPWNSGQAVHETLTLLAIDRAIEKLLKDSVPLGSLLQSFERTRVPRLDEAKGHEFDPKHADYTHQQFIRGVVWADDPKGELFDDAEGTTNYSSGINWGREFKAGEKGEFKADKSDLIARSHYGDLQFMHGMASAAGESPAVTKQSMLGWARFLIDVATGRTKAETLIKDVPAIAKLFPANAGWPIKRLLGNAKASDIDTRQRAVGVLFHLIQDSHAHGHVDRDPKTGDVREFHAYGEQDDHAHGEHDYFGPGANLGERVAATRGASGAIDRCVEVLVMIIKNASTDDIVKHVDQVVLKTTPTMTPAGAGEGLEKREPLPMGDPMGLGGF